MRNVFRSMALVLALILILPLFSPARAAAAPIQIVLDGRRLTTDVPPQLIDGRTMVPVRVVSEGMGAGVAWDGSYQSVLIGIDDYKVIRLQVGNTQAIVDGQYVDLDVPPVNVDGRVLVPLRFVAEAFGYTVAWEPDVPAVKIDNPHGVATHTYTMATGAGTTFKVEYDSQGWTVITGTLPEASGWADVQAVLRNDNSVVDRTTPESDGTFTLRAPFAGGQRYDVRIAGHDNGKYRDLFNFTVDVPAGYDPYLFEKNGVRVTNLFLPVAAVTMVPSVSPEGDLVLDGTAEVSTIQLYNAGESIEIPVTGGRFHKVIPLSGPATYRWQIILPELNLWPGGLQVTQTRAK